MSKPTNVYEYIDSFSGNQKDRLAEVRNIIRDALPGTHEELKWGAPATVESDGMILIIFSGHKNHMNFVVTPSSKQAFESELQGYETGKGSLKLPYDAALPAELIKKMTMFRAQEYRERGVKWK